MCTILTVDRETYNEFQQEIRAVIRQDAVSNSDGGSILLVGKDSRRTTLLRTLDEEVILQLLDTHFSEGHAERAWIHFRLATTAFDGLNGCHGFAAGDYTVFHNGILHRKDSHLFRVDSELIAWEVEAAGPEEAISNLLEKESYANVFLVDNSTGAYHVVRCTSGVLHTDGKGNYSTSRVGPIDKPVPVSYYKHYATPIVVPKPKYSIQGYRWDEGDTEYSDYLENWYREEERRYWDEKYPRTEDTADDGDGSEENSLRHIRDYDSIDKFLDFIEEQAYYRTGIPWEVWEQFTTDQLQWCAVLGLEPAWGSPEQELRNTTEPVLLRSVGIPARSTTATRRRKKAS